MNLTWLLRMAKWVRHPPSPKKAMLIMVVVALCFLIFGIEYFFGWPEALTVEGKARLRPSMITAP